MHLRAERCVNYAIIFASCMAQHLAAQTPNNHHCYLYGVKPGDDDVV